jgi:cell division protein FtsI (penicillin-binding protein 3)
LRLVERRIGLLFALFFLALVVVVMRATWLGTVRADSLRDRAVHQQVDQLVVPAQRGTITDRQGVELAVSEEAVTVFANPFLIGNPAHVADQLAPYLDVDRAELLEKLSDRSKGFVYLRRKLTEDGAQAVRKLKIEGIGTVVEPKRRYPQGFLAAQVLGTVGTDNFGLSGLEQAADERLHGEDGKRRIVKDALGKPINIVEMERAKPGDDLRLTIDAAIQERSEAVLQEVGQKYRPRGATALVMDPRNGEILALANWPRVNANDIEGSPPYARQNRAVGAAYEPGSTFKAFTVGGALEEKMITPDTSYGLPPTLQVADREIKEAHERGAVTLTVSEILAQSSNVGSVKIGLQLGKERFDKWIRRFGFGDVTGIDLPGEERGIVMRPEDYSGASLGNMPIGQGIAVTPIQMAAGYAAIANDGVMPRPHVVAGGEQKSRRVISKRTADQLSRMLEGVLAAGGTGQEAQVPGYKLAGKTGTAQKPDLKLGGYSKYQYFASFIGYAPARDPRLLVAVMVDEPQGAIYGGEVAAPAFEKIVSFALPYMRIPPG